MAQTRKKKNRRIRYDRLALLLFCFFVLIALLAYGLKLLVKGVKSLTAEPPTEATEPPTEATEPTTIATEPPTEPPLEVLESDLDTIEIDGEWCNSEGVILVDITDGRIVAEKNQDQRIYPASLTKIMTILLTVENVEDFNQTYTFDAELLYPLVEAGASRAGFEVDETVTVTDLLYGAALPSGGDATAALAEVVAGDETAFAEMMNERLEELGLHNTHFITASGLHDDRHYSTPRELEMLFAYALENDMVKQILSTVEYTTEPTEQHPEGLLLYSTMFGRMYGNEVEGVQIKGGKTGFTDEAGHCLASYAEADNGHTYVMVTVKAPTRWQSIWDAFELYDTYINGNGVYDPEKKYGVYAE